MNPLWAFLLGIVTGVVGVALYIFRDGGDDE